MRNRLMPMDGTRQAFAARFTGYGNRYVGGKRGIPFERTVLLHDVRDEHDEIVAGHTWINDAAPFRAAGVTPGDRVAFTADVGEYQKGFTGHSLPMLNRQRTDYRLIQVRDLRILMPDQETPVPADM